MRQSWSQISNRVEKTTFTPPTAGRARPTTSDGADASRRAVWSHLMSFPLFVHSKTMTTMTEFSLFFGGRCFFKRTETPNSDCICRTFLIKDFLNRSRKQKHPGESQRRLDLFWTREQEKLPPSACSDTFIKHRRFYGWFQVLDACFVIQWKPVVVMNLPSNNGTELQRWRGKPNICHRVQASWLDECLTAVSVRVLVMDGGDNVIPGTDTLQQDVPTVWWSWRRKEERRHEAQRAQHTHAKPAAAVL